MSVLQLWTEFLPSVETLSLDYDLCLFLCLPRLSFPVYLRLGLAFRPRLLAGHLQCRVQNTPSVVGNVSNGIKRPLKGVLFAICFVGRRVGSMIGLVVRDTFEF